MKKQSLSTKQILQLARNVQEKTSDEFITKMFNNKSKTQRFLKTSQAFRKINKKSLRVLEKIKEKSETLARLLEHDNQQVISSVFMKSPTFGQKTLAVYQREHKKHHSFLLEIKRLLDSGHTMVAGNKVLGKQGGLFEAEIDWFKKILNVRSLNKMLNLANVRLFRDDSAWSETINEIENQLETVAQNLTPAEKRAFYEKHILRRSPEFMDLVSKYNRENLIQLQQDVFRFLIEFAGVDFSGK